MSLVRAAFGNPSDLDHGDSMSFGDASVRATWLQAIVAGAQGRFGFAEALLQTIPELTADRAARSLALSTRASLVRQQGRHGDAAGLDAAAWLLALDDRGHDVAGRARVWRAARLDAAIGVAADDLGRGLLTESATVIKRLAGEAAFAARGIGVSARERPETPWDDAALWDWIFGDRLILRYYWLRAEWALFAGAPGQAATHASRACALAEAGPSVRHRAKSALIAAAAAAGMRDHAGARTLIAEVLMLTEVHRWRPLSVAAEMLAAGV